MDESGMKAFALEYAERLAEQHRSLGPGFTADVVEFEGDLVLDRVTPTARLVTRIVYTKDKHG